MNHADLLTLPECSDHSVLFHRWHEEAAARRLERDLARALEALSLPTTKERGDSET